MQEANVETTKGKLLGRFRKAHSQFKEDRKRYNDDWTILKKNIKDKGFHEVRPITDRQNVDTLSGHFRPDDFSVNVRPLRKKGGEPSQQAKEQANGIEEHASYMLETCGLTSAVSPFNLANKSTWAHGAGVLRGIYDWQAWNDAPVKQEGESAEDFEYREMIWEAQRKLVLPYRLSSPDLSRCLWWPLREPDIFMEIGKVYPIDVKRDYPDFKYQDEDMFTPIDHIEAWDEQTKFYLVPAAAQASTLKQVPIKGGKGTVNPYKFVPYSIMYSGLSMEDPEGKVERMFAGVIHPTKGLVEEQARRLSALSILVQAAALGRGWTRGLEPGKTLTALPGEYIEIGQAEVGTFEVPQAPQDLYNLINMVSQEIDDFIGTKQLGGQKIPGIASALGYELLREESKKRYQAFVDSFEACLARVVGQYLDILENHIAESIPGLKLAPSKIKGHYICEVKLKYKDIAQDRMMAALCRLLYKAGLYDLQTLHGPQFLNSQNFDGEGGILENMLFEKMVFHPDVIMTEIEKLKPELADRRLLEEAQRRGQNQRAINLGSTPTPQPNELDVRAGEDQLAKQLFGPFEGGGSIPGIEGMGEYRG